MNLQQLLAHHQITLTLLDLGASGGSYPPFERAKGFSRLIEVDPDDRAFDTQSKNGRITVNKAITESESADRLKIYLTESPQCTSSLQPDFSKLGNFPYASLFEVVGTHDLPATSLNRLSAELETHFDWIKLDTQGTEHRILKSLNPDLLRGLICCDIEISFYAHYLGADTFPELHQFMVSNGFYISDIVNVQGRARIRKEDEDRLKTMGVSGSSLKKWPTSPELRYLKAINYDEPLTDIDSILRLWAISFVTRNFPYCYFLSQRLKESNPSMEALSVQLEAIVVKELTKRSNKVSQWVGAKLNGLLRRVSS